MWFVKGSVKFAKVTVLFGVVYYSMVIFSIFEIVKFTNLFPSSRLPPTITSTKFPEKFNEAIEKKKKKKKKNPQVNISSSLSRIPHSPVFTSSYSEMTSSS